MEIKKKDYYYYLVQGFSYTKNITNFKAFRWNILLSAKLLLLKSVDFFFQSENRCLYRYITYLLLEPSPRGMFGVLCILVLLHPT